MGTILSLLNSLCCGFSRLFVVYTRALKANVPRSDVQRKVYPTSQELMYVLPSVFMFQLKTIVYSTICVL